MNPTRQRMRALLTLAAILLVGCPKVRSAAPAPGASVHVSAAPGFQFVNDVDPATVNEDTVYLLWLAGTKVPATVSYDTFWREAKITPNQYLAPNINYTFVVKGGPNGVKDLEGNELVGNAEAGFPLVNYLGQKAVVWTFSTHTH